VKVIVAKSAGFCWGVERAIEKARGVMRARGTPVYTDGPLIHNQQMMDQLCTEGIVPLAEPKDAVNGVVVVRAHGIPLERRHRIEAIPASVVDATCPDVARIQGQIRKHVRRGYHVIIFGDAGHAEVEGLLGYAEGRGHVVSSVEDVAGVPTVHPVCIVSQSTQFPRTYAGIAEAVRLRFPDVVVLNTICEATRSRQEELFQLAREADAIVVVGGAHSANTLRLVEIGRALRPTFHVQTGAQIEPSRFRGFSVAGVTGGASTPEFMIEEVRRRLEEL
jgi:(E)-4-hydroxy-3-methyl-but-2-enyl pyrophosphate reductase